jgi:hypothetical protein
MLNRRKAVVVDPNRESRTRVRKALVRRGFEVVALKSHAEAFDLLDGRSPHLLVTEQPGGSYRAVWLGDVARSDLNLEISRQGRKRFDAQAG